MQPLIKKWSWIERTLLSAFIDLFAMLLRFSLRSNFAQVDRALALLACWAIAKTPKAVEIGMDRDAISLLLYQHYQHCAAVTCDWELWIWSHASNLIQTVTGLQRIRCDALSLGQLQIIIQSFVPIRHGFRCEQVGVSTMGCSLFEAFHWSIELIRVRPNWSLRRSCWSVPWQQRAFNGHFRNRFIGGTYHI